MLQTDQSTVTLVGNNSTSNPYPIPFVWFQDSDLQVLKILISTGGETPLAYGVDYTLSGAGSPNGGSMKTTAPVPNTYNVKISRIVPFTQLYSYQEGDSFPAKSHEQALDRIVMIAQPIDRTASS